MNHIQAVFEELTERSNTTNTKSSTSEGIHCPHCGRFVPKMEVEVLGVKRVVQPNCSCEFEIFKKRLKESERQMERRRIFSIFRSSSMGERLENSTFENFIKREGTETAFSQAKRFVEEFENNDGIGLMFFGPPGSGKSHLAAAITNELLARDKTVVFQAVPDLLERIRSTFNRHSSESEQEIMWALNECDLLVLDDIGSEKVTGWVYEVFFRIVDGRYRKKKPIVYTSNLTPKELELRFSEFEDGDRIEIQQTPRILDRITETTDFIKVTASSYRKEIARKRIEARRKESVG